MFGDGSKWHANTRNNWKWIKVAGNNRKSLEMTENVWKGVEMVMTIIMTIPMTMTMMMTMPMNMMMMKNQIGWPYNSSYRLLYQPAHYVCQAILCLLKNSQLQYLNILRRNLLHCIEILGISALVILMAVSSQ